MPTLFYNLSAEESLEYIFLGLKNIVQKDDSLLRQKIFSNLVKQNPGLRLLVAGFENKISRFVVVQLFIFYSFIQLTRLQKKVSSNDPTFFALYEYDNEKRCLYARLPQVNSAFFFEHYSFSNFVKRICELTSFLKKDYVSLLKTILKIYRVSSILISKKGVLIGTRQAQFLWTYSYFCRIFKDCDLSQSQFALSTEGNPNIIAIALAAKKFGGKTIYVSHGFLDEKLGTFFHDILYIQGTALKERILPFLSTKHHHSIHIVSPYFAISPLKIPTSPFSKIGIVLSLVPSEKKVLKLIQEIQAQFKNVQIEIRLHPNLLFSEEIIRLQKSIPTIKILKAQNWKDAKIDWDFAFSANTSAQIDIITKGIPVVGFDLDDLPDDTCSFYKNKFTFKVELLNHIDEKIKDFYQAEHWNQVKNFYFY